MSRAPSVLTPDSLSSPFPPAAHSFIHLFIQQMFIEHLSARLFMMLMLKASQLLSLWSLGAGGHEQTVDILSPDMKNDKMLCKYGVQGQGSEAQEKMRLMRGGREAVTEDVMTKQTL